MSNDIEQYRPSFEAWAEPYGYVIERNGSGYMDDETTYAFQGWCAAKREASTESAKPQEHVMPPFAVPASLLNADELAALRRFDECALDGEGYDVPKEMMQRLAEIGVVRRKSGAYYEHTEFGQLVLEGKHQVDIGALVGRFLGWKLPRDFSPDGGISFDRAYAEQWGGYPQGYPIGTNLLNADQARAMFDYVLDSRCRAQGGNTSNEPLRNPEGLAGALTDEAWDAPLYSTRQDAARYRYIATLRDWSDIEQMCWSSTARSAEQFKRDLDKYIDAKIQVPSKIDAAIAHTKAQEGA